MLYHVFSLCFQRPSNLLKYKRKREKRKLLATGIKFFLCTLYFAFLKTFFFFFWGEEVLWSKLDGNQITLYTFCVHQEKRKKVYFLVAASYKVAFILLFDRLKSCIHNNRETSHRDLSRITTKRQTYVNQF